MLVLLAMMVWMSRWTEVEGSRFDRNIRWGEIPLSPAIVTPLSDPLSYRIKSYAPSRLSNDSKTMPLISPALPKEQTLPLPREESAAVPSAAEIKTAVPQTASPAAGRMDPWLEVIVPAIFESTLPVFTRTALERLDIYMEAAGENKLTRRFTQEELNREVIRAVERRANGQLSDLSARIQAGAFSGSGTVHLGPQVFHVAAKISVRVADQKPHVILHEIQIGSHDLSPETLHRLEKQINRFIDSQRYPLNLKEFHAGDGSVWMSVERA